MTLGGKILELRRAAGLSQEQLGDQVGVSRQAISKWELGESVPDIDKLIQLGKLFSISMDELLSGSVSGDEQAEETKGGQGLSMGEIIKMNTANKLISTGVWSAVIGLVLLILEFLFLPVYMVIEKSLFSDTGFYANAIEYAHVQPMPIVFTLSALIVLLGLGLLACGLFKKRQIKR